MKKLCILTTLILTSLFQVYAQTWEVPSDKKSKVSPFIFNAETAKKGESVFQRNCQSCHGVPGKGNFVALTPSPGDPSTDKFQKQTDGALFFKITNGRSPMPQFKDVLTEEERWQVIAYFRSFNKSYVQAPVGEGKNIAEIPQAIITISYDSASSAILVLATDTLKSPLKNAELKLFVKRYFGNLQIGESVSSDINGKAQFDFPKDIPGDKTGNLEVIVSLTGSDKETKVSKVFKIGVPTNLPPLTANRAMWNIGKKAPLWLLFSYISVVLVIWGFLIYIVILLVKIRKANKKEA